MAMHCFGVGPGWLSEAVARAAENENATLCNYHEGECSCGKGCRLYTCKMSREHWFYVDLDVGMNKRETEARVMKAVRSVATKKDLALLDASEEKNGDKK